MIGKMLHNAKNLSKARCWRKSLVCPKYSWGIWGGVAIPGKFCNFSPLLNLETLFPALKLTRYCYLKSTFFFHENWQFNHKLGPSPFYKHTVPANKIWNQWGFKICSELRKIWKCNIGLLYLKKTIFYLFTFKYQPVITVGERFFREVSANLKLLWKISSSQWWPTVISNPDWEELGSTA